MGRDMRGGGTVQEWTLPRGRDGRKRETSELELPSENDRSYYRRRRNRRRADDNLFPSFGFSSFGRTKKRWGGETFAVEFCGELFYFFWLITLYIGKQPIPLGGAPRTRCMCMYSAGGRFSLRRREGRG